MELAMICSVYMHCSKFGVDLGRHGVNSIGIDYLKNNELELRNLEFPTKN